MATTKTKPAAEEPEVTEPATGEKVELNDEALTAKITAVVKELLGKSPELETETETEVETDTPMTARQEEARAHNIVAEAIKAFKEEFAVDDKKSDKKEAESVPGKTVTRWVERFIWGAE